MLPQTSRPLAGKGLVPSNFPEHILGGGNSNVYPLLPPARQQRYLTDSPGDDFPMVANNAAKNAFGTIGLWHPQLDCGCFPTSHLTEFHRYRVLDRTSHTSSLEEPPYKVYRRTVRLVGVRGVDPVFVNEGLIFLQLPVGDCRSPSRCLCYRAEVEHRFISPTTDSLVLLCCIMDSGAKNASLSWKYPCD